MKRKNPLERFKAKVRKTRGCWKWLGRKNWGGYGLFYLDGKQKLAHRVSYEFARDIIPKGLQVDHLCRNRGCVNPSHMELVTPRENTLRGNGIAAQHARKTHCIRGHEFTKENTLYAQKRYRVCKECSHAWSRAHPKHRKKTIVKG